MALTISSSQSSCCALVRLVTRSPAGVTKKKIAVAIHRQRHFLDVAIVETVGVDAAFGRPLAKMAGALFEPVREDRALALAFFVHAAEQYVSGVSWLAAGARSDELIVRALDPPVVELSTPVGLLTEERLELAARCQDVVRPCFESTQDGRHGSIELASFGGVAEAVAVGRVGNETTVAVIGSDRIERLVLEPNVLGDAGFARMGARECESLGVAVRAEDRYRRWRRFE